jgi:hypothetical protein
MSNTQVQGEVERWLVENCLAKRYHMKFAKKKLLLLWGGKFEFDAVSEDNKTAGCISTSSAQTATGRAAVGKYHKIKADAFYLNAAVGVAKKFLLFTDDQMKRHFKKERDKGRFPQDIKLLYEPVPAHLRTRLQESAAVASREVRPSK